jgi:hypothetical protein
MLTAVPKKSNLADIRIANRERRTFHKKLSENENDAHYTA